MPEVQENIHAPLIDYPISLRLPSQKEVERRSSRRQVLQ